jgi:hypothetical protein
LFWSRTGFGCRLFIKGTKNKKCNPGIGDETEQYLVAEWNQPDTVYRKKCPAGNRKKIGSLQFSYLDLNQER